MKWPLLLLILIACNPYKQMSFPENKQTVTGRSFYEQALTMRWKQRDSLAVEELLGGSVPDFLKRFVPVHVSVTDSATGKTINATYFAAPDYLSIGTNDNWARIPLTPMAAQQVADSFDCFLPTRKMVNDIYKAATLKIAPVPIIKFRDSTITMWQHNSIIEGQRKNRKGLIAGIKKDVVISGRVSRDAKANRVAIYGWHLLDGTPIQPLYTGHVNWYVDYSHGIRLVYRKIRINKHWMDYTEVLNDPVLQKLLCDEEFCDFYRYSY